MSRKSFFIIGLFLVIILVLAEIFFRHANKNIKNDGSAPVAKADSVWIAPDSLLIPNSQAGELIKYGRALISNTADFLGPHGKVAAISNGMNCQNCHLDAGTKPWGNNY